MRACVIEDDPDFRDLVREVLETSGWTVDLADDGIAALARIHHAVPDLIILDLLMPNLDGCAVLKLLRSTEVGRRIPVVVTTGIPVDDIVRDLASVVLVKHLATADMTHAIESLTRSLAASS